MATSPRRDWLSERRSFWAALVLGSRRGSLCRQVSTWAPLFSVQRLSYRFPLMCELWREFCNAPLRILSLHEIGAEDNGLDLRVVGIRECPAGSDEYRSRSEGIQSLRKMHPWATLRDCATFLEGHAAGVEFGIHSDIPKHVSSWHQDTPALNLSQVNNHLKLSACN